ncbi:MFS transporter [uncultured Brevibacillus sp.]|uniref:MFS transporter n=1 Tax=uncultured Brevibacillus sp. TaxID=169970 RepID=UPI0025939C40|nr:MFS transporter [uncultured Brevibacillus sp.]
MTEQKFYLDDAPLNKFHYKITALTFGAHFTDGYALGIIGIVLTLLTPQMQLSPLWVGLLGSSALIGLFFGSLILGWLSDRIGRQKIFLFNFLLITVASFLQFFVQNEVELFILRVLVGFGLGGDYAVGTTLLAEFTPKKYRGPFLGALNVVWTIGYVSATLIGYYFHNASPETWRWMLASTSIFSFIVLLLRIGTPESPRWLISKGRVEEARNIVKKFVGFNAELDETTIESRANFSTLFHKKLRTRTAFSGLFFVCMVIPYFAIYTFLPSILTQLGFEENFTTDLLLNGLLIVGSFFGIWFSVRFSRRGFLISSFAILTISLLMLSLLPSGSKFLLVLFFAVFTLLMSAVNNLAVVYPPEIFPTEVRTSGVGFATAVSRLGSAAGTFLLPISIIHYGVSASMLALTAVLFIGTIVSIAWAPETKALTLREASNSYHAG